MSLIYVNLESLIIDYWLNYKDVKILKETIGYVSFVTQTPLEMNFIIFYNVHTLSKTVRTSSQVTLEIGQLFLNLKILWP
jgi:hypothetical protein